MSNCRWSSSKEGLSMLTPLSYQMLSLGWRMTSGVASQITGVPIVCSKQQRYHSTALLFVGETHLWSVDSYHKYPIMRKVSCHDVIMTWWRHRMATFSALLALYAMKSPQGQWRGALMFSAICAWTNDRVNNWDAGDLRRYIVLIMTSL